MVHEIFAPIIIFILTTKKKLVIISSGIMNNRNVKVMINSF